MTVSPLSGKTCAAGNVTASGPVTLSPVRVAGNGSAPVSVPGALQMSATDRTRFANDLDFGPSLEAITDNVNSSKQDRDPAQWMPPLASNHCHYAIRWVQVKYRWKLTIDAAERDKLSSVLSGSCGRTSVAIPTRAR